jgi:hypothetical protein
LASKFDIKKKNPLLSLLQNHYPKIIEDTKFIIVKHTKNSSSLIREQALMNEDQSLIKFIKTPSLKLYKYLLENQGRGAEK